MVVAALCVLCSASPAYAMEEHALALMPVSTLARPVVTARTGIALTLAVGAANYVWKSPMDIVLTAASLVGADSVVEIIEDCKDTLLNGAMHIGKTIYRFISTIALFFQLVVLLVLAYFGSAVFCIMHHSYLKLNDCLRRWRPEVTADAPRNRMNESTMRPVPFEERLAGLSFDDVVSRVAASAEVTNDRQQWKESDLSSWEVGDLRSFRYLKGPRAAEVRTVRITDRRLDTLTGHVYFTTDEVVKEKGKDTTKIRTFRSDLIRPTEKEAKVLSPPPPKEAPVPRLSLIHI